MRSDWTNGTDKTGQSEPWLVRCIPHIYRYVCTSTVRSSVRNQEVYLPVDYIHPILTAEYFIVNLDPGLISA